MLSPAYGAQVSGAPGVRVGAAGRRGGLRRPGLRRRRPDQEPGPLRERVAVHQPHPDHAAAARQLRLAGAQGRSRRPARRVEHDGAVHGRAVHLRAQREPTGGSQLPPGGVFRWDPVPRRRRLPDRVPHPRESGTGTPAGATLAVATPATSWALYAAPVTGQLRVARRRARRRRPDDGQRTGRRRRRAAGLAALRDAGRPSRHDAAVDRRQRPGRHDAEPLRPALGHQPDRHDVPVVPRQHRARRGGRRQPTRSPPPTSTSRSRSGPRAPPPATGRPP